MLDIKKESFVKLRNGEIRTINETGVINDFRIDEWSNYNLSANSTTIDHRDNFDLDIIAAIRLAYSQEDKSWVADHYCVKCGSLVKDAIGKINYDIFGVKFVDKMSYKQCPECKVFICQ